VSKKKAASFALLEQIVSTDYMRRHLISYGHQPMFSDYGILLPYSREIAARITCWIMEILQVAMNNKVNSFLDLTERGKGDILFQKNTCIATTKTGPELRILFVCTKMNDRHQEFFRIGKGEPIIIHTLRNFI
jgi:hypothetical protein